MFNRVSELSKRTFASGASPETGSLEADALEPLVDDAETVQHVLASAGGIEHTTNDRTATIEPERDRHAYAVVTDRRLLFVLESDPGDPEVTIPLEDVSRVTFDDGLLSSKLTVRTPAETIAFEPVADDAAEGAASYVEHTADAWADLTDALDGVRTALADVESTIAAGEDPRSAVQTARSRLSSAYHAATRVEDAPTALMEAEIEPVERDLDRLRVEARCDRAAEMLEAARMARNEGDHEAAARALVEGHDVLADARAIAADSAHTSVGEPAEATAEELAAAAAAMLADAEQACYRGMEAEDPALAVEAWEVALERYRAAVAAGWDGPADTSIEALRYQLTWVVASLVDALRERAAALEAEADELEAAGEDAADRYEDAKGYLVRARDLTEQHPDATPRGFADPLARLQEKIERTEWQWGAPAADD